MNDIDVRGQTLAKLVSRCIVPIFWDKEGIRPKHVGTGFLITDGKHYYLASAAHVFDELRKESLYFPINSGWRVFFGSRGLLTQLPSRQDRQADTCDVGVFQLNFDRSHLNDLKEAKRPSIFLCFYLMPFLAIQRNIC